MEKWLSVSQINDETSIPETTIRRYLNSFSEYFRAEKIGRGMKYHPDSVAILKRIYSLYNEDYETPEIQKLLDMEFAITVEEQKDETTIQPPSVILEREFEEFKQQQQEFNKQLLKQLQEQQKYIKNSIESRDQKLMQALNEIQETKKQIAMTEEKRWWEFWK